MVGAPERRPDLRLKRGQAEAARRVVDDGWSEYAPSLNFLFQGGFLWPYGFPAAVGKEIDGWALGLVLTLPIYEGGARDGLASERRALLERAEHERQMAILQSRSEVRVAFEAVRTVGAALDRARRAAALAHDALQVADLAYRAGATTNIELIDAERRARDADTTTGTLENAWHQAQVECLSAAGRLP